MVLRRVRLIGSGTDEFCKPQITSLNDRRFITDHHHEAVGSKGYKIRCIRSPSFGSGRKSI